MAGKKPSAAKKPKRMPQRYKYSLTLYYNDKEWFNKAAAEAGLAMAAHPESDVLGLGMAIGSAKAICLDGSLGV